MKNESKNSLPINELIVTHEMRRHGKFMRTIACVTIAAFLSLNISPAIAAVKQYVKSPPSYAPRAKSDEEQFSDKVSEIETTLQSLGAKLNASQDGSGDEAILKQQKADLETLNAKVMANFDAIGQKLVSKHLPKLILQRQADAVARYKKEYQSLLSQLKTINQSKDNAGRKAAIKALSDELKSKHRPTHRDSAGPNDFSNGTVKPDRNRKPKETKSAWRQAGLYNNPTVKLAANGSFTFDKLPGASDPAYLGESDEVVLTPAIKAKAAELQNDPIKIYNWVRNNIDWIPSWGASQEAEITLSSQRGNAMDISSLLIALYRASGIPARYVHGTIDVPEATFRSWAGGFESVQAAADYASANGIPITLVSSGGKVTKVRFEHIWVEAAIDFNPSRGAVNRSADTWVELDPSFKLHEVLKGLDVVAISGIDPGALTTSFSQSGTSNEAEGWVQGLDSTILQSAQIQAQAALETHITNMTNPTVGDVIGGIKIVQLTNKVLPSGLPFNKKVTGARYSKIPAALQNRIQLAFGLNLMGEPVDPIEYPMAKVNNRKITLSFKPATAADEDALLALFPTDEVTDPSQLPGSIPSYLINVVPTLEVEGKVVKQGGLMNLGHEVPLAFGIKRVGPGSHTYVYPVDAGAYLSVSVYEGSVSTNAISNDRTKLLDTKNIIDSGDLSKLQNSAILGDTFYTGSLGYFSQYIKLSSIIVLKQKGYHNLVAGYGTYGYEPHVSYVFGVPRAIEPGTIVTNVRLVRALGTSTGDNSQQNNLNLQTGMLSSTLEHTIPEQMFSTSSNSGQAVSAVKALSIASANGQRMYRLNSTNMANTLPLLHFESETIEEIKSAILSGKDVITHTDPIVLNNWSGAGYIIIDPSTGDGSYKISGGKNGSDYWDSEKGGTAFFAVISVGDFLEKMANLYASLIGLFKPIFGKLIETVTWFIDLISDLVNCPAPLGQVLAVFSTIMLLSIWWTTFLIGTIAIGGFIGAVIGALIGMTLSAGIGLYLDEFRKEHCTK